MVADGWGQWKEYVLSSRHLLLLGVKSLQRYSTCQHARQVLSCRWRLRHLQLFSHSFSTLSPLFETLLLLCSFLRSLQRPSCAETGPGSISRNHSNDQSKRLALMLNSFNTMLAMEKRSGYRIGLAQLWLCIPPFRQESCRPSWMTWWWLARPITSYYIEKTWTSKQDCWNFWPIYCFHNFWAANTIRL